MIEFTPDVYRRACSLLQPARFNLLVRLYKNPEQKGRIVLTQKSQDDANISECRAEIWIMAPACFTGKEWPHGNTLEIKPGDWILMASYAGGQVKFMNAWPDEEFRLISDTEILARIESPDEVNRKW